MRFGKVGKAGGVGSVARRWNAAVAAAAIGAGLLAGPTLALPTTYTNPSLTPCTGSVCAFTVTIVHSDQPYKCILIDVSPMAFDLSQGPATKTITWTITNTAFDWTPSAGAVRPIKFGVSGSGVFSTPKIAGSVVSVTYTRPAQGSHKYNYGVNTRHRLLNKACNIDPWLVD